MGMFVKSNKDGKETNFGDKKTNQLEGLKSQYKTIYHMA